MSQRRLFALAISAWIVTIAFVPVRTVIGHDGLPGVQTVFVAAAITLTLMWWLRCTGAEYRAGYRTGYEKALHDITSRRR